jgi:hypothetical protein
MKRRKPRIIKDKKMRGEWAESVFVGRASEHGLPVSKPCGDSESFDCVVGRPGKFVAVQVKCTIAELKNGRGYACSTCSSGKPYRAGSFDFLAAYVVLEDAWYIIPAKKIRGMKSISLFTKGGKYEEYREAWHLLREAVELDEEPEGVAEVGDAESGARLGASELAERESDGGGSGAGAVGAGFPTNAMGRMQSVEKYVRRYLDGDYPRAQKEREDG